MPRRSLTCWLHLVVSATLILSATAQDATETGRAVDFAREVLPILSNKCFVCHGPASKKKDLLRLDSYRGATADLGGYRAIDPDDPSESEILQRLHDTAEPMPPRDAQKQLTDAERTTLTRWARQGGEYARHWAFVPPVKRPPGARAENPIDGYVLAQLRGAKIDLAPCW